MTAAATFEAFAQDLAELSAKHGMTLGSLVVPVRFDALTAWVMIREPGVVLAVPEGPEGPHREKEIARAGSAAYMSPEQERGEVLAEAVKRAREADEPTVRGLARAAHAAGGRLEVRFEPAATASWLTPDEPVIEPEAQPPVLVLPGSQPPVVVASLGQARDAVITSGGRWSDELLVQVRDLLTQTGQVEIQWVPASEKER